MCAFIVLVLIFVSMDFVTTGRRKKNILLLDGDMMHCEPTGFQDNVSNQDMYIG